MLHLERGSGPEADLKLKTTHLMSHCLMKKQEQDERNTEVSVGWNGGDLASRSIAEVAELAFKSK